VSATAVADIAVVAVRIAVEDNDVSPGVLGFLVVAVLGGATYLLIRSMNRQIGRIDLPDDADDGDDAGGATDGAGSAAGPDEPRAERPDGPEPDGRGLSPR
jgi:hypothetical protein